MELNYTTSYTSPANRPYQTTATTCYTTPANRPYQATAKTQCYQLPTEPNTPFECAFHQCQQQLRDYYRDSEGYLYYACMVHSTVSVWTEAKAEAEWGRVQVTFNNAPDRVPNFPPAAPSLIACRFCYRKLVSNRVVRDWTHWEEMDEAEGTYRRYFDTAVCWSCKGSVEAEQFFRHNNAARADYLLSFSQAETELEMGEVECLVKAVAKVAQPPTDEPEPKVEGTYLIGGYYHYQTHSGQQMPRGVLYCGHDRFGDVEAVGQPGWLGNPCKKGGPCSECHSVHAEGWQTLPCYAVYLRRRLQLDKQFKVKFMQQLGRYRVLACSCDEPSDCHVSVLLWVYLQEKEASEARAAISNQSMVSWFEWFGDVCMMALPHYDQWWAERIKHRETNQLAFPTLYSFKEYERLEALRLSFAADDSDERGSAEELTADADQRWSEVRPSEVDTSSDTRSFYPRRKPMTNGQKLIAGVMRQHELALTDLSDDLAQAGYVGLLTARQKFDPRKAGKNGAFAEAYILGELMQGLADYDQLSAPRRLRDLANRLKKLEQQLLVDSGELPTDVDLAAMLGVKVSLMRETRHLNLVVKSLDRRFADGDDGTLTLGDTVEAPKMQQRPANDQAAERVRYLMQVATDRQRAYLTDLFGLDGSGQKTVGEVANRFGLKSHQAVSSANALAYRKMRKLDEVGLERFPEAIKAG